MPHLFHRFLANRLGEPFVTPVAAHLRMNEVLIDAGELGGDDLVQHHDDLAASFHAPFLAARRRSRASATIRQPIEPAVRRPHYAAPLPPHKASLRPLRDREYSSGLRRSG